MKYIAAILLSIFTINSFSQTNHYFPMPDSNAIWNNYHFEEAGHCMNGVHATRYESKEFSYFINGDTTLLGNVYHKIYSSTVLVHSYCAFVGTQDVFSTEPGKLAGVYRQDTMLRRVYTFDTTSNQECLLMDFGLNINDTLDSVCNNLWNTWKGDYVVLSIDSVLIGNSYRKRLNFGATRAIEGIGNTSGLFGYAHCFCDQEVVCFSQDGQTVYPDTISQCSVVTGVHQINLENQQTSVFPNPFFETTTLYVADEFINGKMTIYNMTGNKIRQQEISQNNTLINRNGLNDGIYFFNIINEKGQRINGKLIVQ